MAEGRKSDVTRLLQQWTAGRPEALDTLLPLVYDELRRMARIQLSREPRRHTLQPTELVHEAFVKLVDQRVGWQNRLHFYGIAGRCMRRLLVDHARKKRAAKRPQDSVAVDIGKVEIGQSTGIDTMLAIDAALQRLKQQSARQAQVAELKLFAGLEMKEIADLVGVSVETVKRDWKAAQDVLAAAITGATL
jgi:RNA polymerase sigma factor (TIGR02999 family)